MNLMGMSKMIFLILAIISSGMIAVIFKFSEEKQPNRLAITTFNYINACIISFFMLSNKKILDLGWFNSFKIEAQEVFLLNESIYSNEASAAWAVIIGSITGIIYFLSFWLYQYNVKKNGAALSSTFMKLGVLVPTILSIFIFKEIPTKLQILGLLLAIAGMVIINLSMEKDIIKSIKIDLFLLFIMGGLGDFNSKLYQNYGQNEHKELFVFYIFITALIVSSITLFIKNRKVKSTDIIAGLLVGIPNQFTAYFLVRSLNYVKASIAFPIFSSGTILFVNIINIIYFKEKLSKNQYISIGIIAISLIFLNI
ncbi:EamA-like transporter family protein [Maledivibacter halophilus]|uniref:EamA-like transporter family protein n=2 Tax=Maledivibacter halophilus TaxID=36842 RepID=A0A1T5J412_9FIRM|nr:EamA-like transporter family protein [Maledivibacter halophilus]